MTNMLTINTSSGLMKPEKIDPLPVFGEHFSMLKQVMPEYTGEYSTKELSTLVKRMKLTRKQFGAIGLSANQCGIRVRLFVLGTEEFDLVCINPKILESSEETEKSDEGCLSFPGLYLSVDRPKWILTEFTDENGKLIQLKVDGITARCFSHELDHLNGVKFTEQVGATTMLLARQRQQKLIKKMSKSKKTS